MEKSFIIHLLHSIPHINISLQFVNSTFNPNSDVYVEVSTLLSRPGLPADYIQKSFNFENHEKA
jgi:hypothetical protein